MAMFRPFLAILGIVYDISFLSPKNQEEHENSSSTKIETIQQQTSGET
jgi:hypothetical protein